MVDYNDFDEDTLETIEPIKQMRINNFRNKNLREYIFCLDKSKDAKKFLKDNNIFLLPRNLYEKSKTENIEALLTKFNEIIIDDTEKPYIPLFSKAEKTKYIVGKIAKNINQKNFDKGMKKFDSGMKQFHKSLDSISDMTNSIGTDPRPRRKRRSSFFV